MAIYQRCSTCHSKITIQKSICKCGRDLRKDNNRLYYIAFKVNKKKRWEAAGNSLKLARELEAKRKNEKYENRLSTVKKELKHIYFSDFVDVHFAPHYQMKNKGYKKEKGRFNIIKSYLGNLQLNSITEFDVDQLLKRIMQERELSKSTVNRYIATLKRMFNYAIELNIITVNPARHQKQQFVDNKRTRYLSHEEMGTLLDAAKASNNPYLYYIIQMALMTGMRMSEILSLKPSDIYLEQRYMIINQTNTKNKKQRFVPLNDTLHDCLKEYYTKFEPNKDEKLFRTVTIYYAFYKAVDAAGLENFRFHDMRHTFGSHLAQNKVDLYAVSELLGHSDITVTQRYAHLNKEHLQNAVNRLV